MDFCIQNGSSELWIIGSGMNCLTYGLMDPECNDLVSFFICRSMDNSEEFEQELYDGVDVWDGLHDDDIEKSLWNKKIDNISKGYECTNVFTTNEVKLSL